MSIQTELCAAYAKKKTERNFAHIEGTEWTAQELYAQGISKDKIQRFIKHGLITRTKCGHYQKV